MVRGWVRGFLLGAALACQPAWADLGSLPMVPRNWSSLDGLPQDHIRTMLRTRDGFLWLGTDAGLARFDGWAFKNYGLREGLGAVTVVDLLEARDGALWIFTLGGDVSVLRDGRIGKTYTSGDGLPPQLYSTLSEDADGAIRVSGAFRLEGGKFVRESGMRLSNKRFLRDRSGTMWLITNSGGLARWKDGKWTDGSDGGPRSALAICEDGDGKLWITDTSRKLWCRDGAAWRSWALPESEGAAAAISAAPDGTLWIVCHRDRILAFRGGSFFNVETSDASFLGLAETVQVGADGVVWLGTSTRGLFSLTPAKIQAAVLEVPDGAAGANFIGALAEIRPGEFMVGSQGRGLFRWRDGVTTPVAEMGDQNRGLMVNAMLRAADGTVWVGSGRGLHGFLPEGGFAPQIRGSDTVRDVWQLSGDGAGGLWIGKGGGELQHVPGNGGRIPYANGDGGAIKGLALSRDGALWIGTRGKGLFRYQDGKSRRFGMAEGLRSEVIRVVECLGDGSLWVGTAGGGLAVLTGERFNSITAEEGLPDDIVSQIAEDSNHRLWVGTNRGLAVLSREEAERLKQGRITHVHPLVINRADGLVAEECTIVPPVHMNDGRMAFASTNGFSILRPEDFAADTVKPPVFLEEIFANGKWVSPKQGHLGLTPGLERLEIHYTGLFYPAPKRLRFRTRLVGLETDWGNAGTLRSVEYRNIPPGEYQFEVSASNGNGLWTEPPRTISISIAPYFWQTLWFKIVGALAALAGVAFLVRWQERALARRKIERLKREQAVYEERARIARDLHDDVGASLTQVALLSELADSDLPDRPEQARELINEIFTTAKDVTRSLDEIVWAVNPAQDTLERFSAFLGNFVQGYARSTGLASRIEIPEEAPAVTVNSTIRHHLYLATKEALHNVVKHADATEVHLKLFPETTSIRIIIQDNGKGLDGPDQGEGDGLDNLRSRLSHIGGFCLHRQAPEGGTIVEMSARLDGA